MLSDGLLTQLGVLASVVVIDVVLAGDNALVVGLAAAGLERDQQRRVIAIGVGIALACRILFAVIAVQLLAVIGLLLAGGLLLLWVAWKMWRDIHTAHAIADLEKAVAAGSAPALAVAPAKSYGAAIWQVAIADVSMSLDNVLAVAGVARDHLEILIFGLVLSIALMGVAATYIARYMQRWPWLTYLGLAVVTWVAVSMIWRGGLDVVAAVGAH